MCQVFCLLVFHLQMKKPRHEEFAQVLKTGVMRAKFTARCLWLQNCAFQEIEQVFGRLLRRLRNGKGIILTEIS